MGNEYLFERPGVGCVTWGEGFWGERFRLCRETMIDRMWEALHAEDNGARMENFARAAKLEDGPHLATFWSDGDCYKWIEACAHVYGATLDEGLRKRMAEAIAVIGKAQDADGYINTQIQLDPKKKRWAERRHHELYNLGHLFTAAAVHYRTTGEEAFLETACRAADYVDSVFRPRPPELAAFGWNPSNIMGLIDLHRATGERKYLELAGIFVDMRGTAPGAPQNIWEDPVSRDPHPGDQNQNRVPLRKETQAVGHAVTAMYLYAGATDVAALTGEAALREALLRVWRNVVERKQYVTGAVGAYHNGLSVRGDRVHEAFAADFELPNRTAYNETCANIGNAMWNWRLLKLTGDAAHADVMELVLYNSALSAMDLGGTHFCYTNPLARAREATMLSHDTPERWFTHKCYCCPPQVLRTLAGLHDWAYGIGEDAVWVNLYGGSQCFRVRLRACRFPGSTD